MLAHPLYRFLVSLRARRPGGGGGQLPESHVAGVKVDMGPLQAMPAWSHTVALVNPFPVDSETSMELFVG